MLNRFNDILMAKCKTVVLQDLSGFNTCWLKRFQVWHRLDLNILLQNPYNWFNSYIDGLAQDCSNSSALAIELLQSCTKPLISWLPFIISRLHIHKCFLPSLLNRIVTHFIYNMPEYYMQQYFVQLSILKSTFQSFIFSISMITGTYL